MCLALAASGMFYSCSEDMPNVNFVNVVSNSSDFRDVIKALEDQTTTLETKLQLVEDAINSTQRTLDEKLQIIETAIKNGVSTYKELAEKLIESINKSATSQAEKIDAICDILASTQATLELQLAAIEEAVKAGFGTYKEMAEALIESINKLEASQAEKLQLIYDILDSELATLSQKVADVAAAIEQGFIDNKDAIDALNKAIADALSDRSADLADRLGDIKEGIEDIKESIDTGFVLEKQAIVNLASSLLYTIESNATSEAEKLQLIADAIGLLTGNIEACEKDLIKLLVALKEAIEKRTDYSGIIEAIRSLVDPDPQPKYEAVDLGLSVKWATFNVGAKSETDYGDYFAWGETAPKIEYTWENYKWGDLDLEAEPDYGMTKYNTKDHLTILKPEDDAATANWGDDWRTPTVDEFIELDNNCDWTWTTKKDAKGNDVNGYTLTSKKNGNSIFLPATSFSGEIGWYGNYWSSSLSNLNVRWANSLFFMSDRIEPDRSNLGRKYDCCVRPVLKPSSER